MRSLSVYLLSTNQTFPLCRDTVNSVGIFPHRLPFTTSNKLIKTFRHAVSLDERRAKFKVFFCLFYIRTVFLNVFSKANLWNPDPETQKVEIDSVGGHKKSNGRHLTREALERRYWKDPNQTTDVKEVCVLENTREKDVEVMTC